MADEDRRNFLKVATWAIGGSLGAAVMAPLLVDPARNVRNEDMSMLNGTYKNANTGATLTITEANDANGELRGSITYPDITLPVSGHYHFLNSGGPRTIIQFVAMNDDARYEAWVLVADDMNFTMLKSMGGRAGFDGSLVGIGGAFARV